LLIQLLIDRTQVNELQELRQTISNRENNTVSRHGHGQDITLVCGVTDDNPSPLISPVSSSGYHSIFDGEDAAFNHLHNPKNAKENGHLVGDSSQEGCENKINIAPTITTSLSLQVPRVIPANKPGYSAWDVGFIGNSAATLKLNLVHKLTLEGRIRVAFSVDGKHLATASSLGIVSIFDSRTGKRIR